MTVSTVLYLFLAHLGLGMGFGLLVVSSRAGVKFFRFTAGSAAGLLFLAITMMPEAAAEGLAARVARDGLVVATGGLGFYWLTVGRVLRPLRRVALPVATAAGLVALVAHGIAFAADALVWQVLTVISVLSSAALLGGSCNAMILGHWYLVVPSLDVAHLQSLVKLHLASTILRSVVVLGVVLLAVSTAQPGMGPAFSGYITSVAGIFFWQRVLFGLVGPIILAYLTWETAKIRSTQSATGILYVDFFTVIVGEVLAKYLLLATQVPV